MTKYDIVWGVAMGKWLYDLIKWVSDLLTDVLFMLLEQTNERKSKKINPRQHT